MGGVKGVLAAIRQERREGGALGVWVGLAAGLFVASPVSRVFLAIDFDEAGIVMGLLFGAIAFACTTVGAVMAVRAGSTAKAVGWTFATNVIPPTLVCLPSVYGVVFSFPAGLIAFAAVLPMVLLARWGRGSAGQESRERIVGALWLTAMGAALVYWETQALSDPYPRRMGLEVAPMLLTGLGALALAVASAGVDTFRLWMWDGVVRGAFPGLRARASGRFGGVIERYADTGQGPMRSAATSDDIGTLSASPARAVLGIGLTVAAVAVGIASVWVCTLPQAAAGF